MSQAKVDKRKYEKIHRKEIERKRKISIMVKCITAAVIIGVIIAVPTGISIYNSIPKFVGDASLSAFVNNYIDEKYASQVAVLNAEDTTEYSDAVSELGDALEDVLGTEAQAVNVDDIDEELGNDSEETTESSDGK